MFWFCITEVNFYCWLYNFLQGGGQLPLRLPPTSSIKQAKPMKKPPPSKVLNPKWVCQSNINLSPGEGMLFSLMKMSDKVWQCPRVWEFLCFSLSHSCMINLALSVGEFAENEMILNCWVKLAVERVVCLVCMCWLANWWGLSLNSQWPINCKLTIVNLPNFFRNFLTFWYYR